jgi:hypothetical protein
VTDVGWEIIEKLTRVLELDPANPGLAEGRLGERPSAPVT